MANDSSSKSRGNMRVVVVGQSHKMDGPKCEQRSDPIQTDVGSQIHKDGPKFYLTGTACRDTTIRCFRHGRPCLVATMSVITNSPLTVEQSILQLLLLSSEDKTVSEPVASSFYVR